MVKLLFAVLVFTALGYAAFQYVGTIGAKSVDNAKVAEEVLEP